MSLPPGFLDELRTRLTLSSVVGRKVTWDMRKSNMAKGDWWAPCPFHQEKSASFHVDDRKGFYYCFGCHAKGDVLTFVKEAENLGFMEAVESLAREAGMAMPARDPQMRERIDRRGQLIEVMEEAVKYYRLQLKTTAAGSARDYLARRRLSPEAQERWGIGFAPDVRQGLLQALAQKGIAADLVVAAGLAAVPEGGGAPYDRFRGRIIFPIRDGRGRAISLGGRAMDANARAKYLNGPETEIFDKGRNLFNHAPAREAAGKGATLIVAEGYMDVIALAEAGFRATVAPLGTAVTEDQLRLMWRIASEPVIALDGDAAGQRAALRVIDLALPMIEAGQGLRFAVLPVGLDPDDLIKAQGAGAMQAVLERAEPMVKLLWRRETEGQVFDSPERRAALDKRLRAAISRITDPSIRQHYGEAIREMRGALYGTAPRRNEAFLRKFTRGGPGGAAGASGAGGSGRGFSGGRREGPVAPAAETRGSLLASSDHTDTVREAVVLATCITHPALIHRFESELERMELSTGDHARLRGLILGCADADGAGIRERIAAEAGAALDSLFRHPHVRSAPPVRNAQDTEFAALCLAEGLAKLSALRGSRREIEDAVEDLSGLPDEGITWRLGRAAEARHRADRATKEDATDLGEDRAALSNHLQKLIDGQIWVKKNR